MSNDWLSGNAFNILLCVHIFYFFILLPNTPFFAKSIIKIGNKKKSINFIIILSFMWDLFAKWGISDLQLIIHHLPDGILLYKNVISYWYFETGVYVIKFTPQSLGVMHFSFNSMFNARLANNGLPENYEIYQN